LASRPYAIPSSRQRTRSVSNILGEESSNQSSPTPSRIRRLVPCNCSECNGRLIDPCTKTIHEINQNSEDNDNSEVHVPELSNDDQDEVDSELMMTKTKLHQLTKTNLNLSS
jgi:hypothetical protein